MPMFNQSPVSGDALTAVVSASAAGRTGLVQGSAAGSRVWTLTGPGAATAEYHPDGYIYEPSQLNTYCHINTGATSVRRVRQVSHGATCTIEIGLNQNLTDMIHQNFTSGGDPSITFWKTGVGTSQQPRWRQQVATCPIMTDGPHEFVLEVFDNIALAYVDGTLVHIGYDERFTSIQGGWIFGQLHSGGANSTRIYSLDAYTAEEIADINLRNNNSAVVSAQSVAAKTITVGRQGGAGFIPVSDSYFWVGNPIGHVFSSSTTTVVEARAQATGHGARLRARSALNFIAELECSNIGYGIIKYGNTEAFRFDSNGFDAQLPIRYKSYTVATLPSAATFARGRAIVTDASSPAFGATVVGGGATVIPVYSDGTAWRVG